MKPRADSADGTASRRAAARRTALVLGIVAVLLFVFSILKVVWHR